jgi:hypothetical protein
MVFAVVDRKMNLDVKLNGFRAELTGVAVTAPSTTMGILADESYFV